MSIITILIGLAVVGFFCACINQIDMPQKVKNIITGIMVFVLILWILQQFGYVGNIPALKFK